MICDGIGMNRILHIKSLSVTHVWAQGRPKGVIFIFMHLLTRYLYDIHINNELVFKRSNTSEQHVEFAFELKNGGIILQ